MRSFNMEVNTKQTKDGKVQYVPVGSVEVFYPLLSELGLSATPEKFVKVVEGKDVEVKEEDAAAFPVYSDEKVQYVFDSVLASVKASARNKLQPNTALLKDGLSIASTVEELLESGAGNKGEALANIRASIKAFELYLKGSGKSEKLQMVLLSLFASHKSILVASAKRVTQLDEAVQSFVSAASAEVLAKAARHLTKVSEAIVMAREEEDEGDE